MQELRGRAAVLSGGMNTMSAIFGRIGRALER